MANIDMNLVKQLREKTQVGMMDCKKALVEAQGDIEKAIELLRKKGAAVAAKRADQATENGRIEGYVTQDFKQGALVEIACETDFSANTNDMKNFAILIAQSAITEGVTSSEELLEKNPELKNQHHDLLAKISERIDIKEIALFSVEKQGIVNSYIHAGSTVGVLVELLTDHDLSGHLEELKTVSRDICMHIAVTNPLCIDPDGLDQKLVEKEQSIIRDQLKNSGKPDNIVEKIALGRINKYYEEVCLSRQKFIKDDSLSIEQYLKKISEKLKNKLTVKRFSRFSIGRK